VLGADLARKAFHDNAVKLYRPKAL
jgi:hypothetical protein